MSDTQGAPDTATGGLENDMPAIGSAPPSPRMVPSPLGGVAAFARQLGMGGPAPRPAPAPRDPTQIQIGPPPQGRPPQQMPSRWEGTTASLSLPKGSDQPLARFTPYRPSLPRSDWREYGQPEAYPNLPQSFELPGLAQNLSRFFGQSGGTGPSIATAMLMGQNADAYIKAVKDGQEYAAKVAKEKWLEHSLALQEQQENMHHMYTDKIGEYLSMAGGDEKKLATQMIKGVSLNDALWNVSVQIGDKDVQNMLEDGADFQKIMDYQKVRDAGLRDLQKVNKKASEQEEEDAGFQGKPDPNAQAGGGGGGTIMDRLGGQPQGQPPSQPAGGLPQGAPAPTQTAGGGGLLRDLQGQPSGAQGGVQGFTPDEMQGGLDFAKGAAGDSLAKGYAGGREKAYATQVQGAIDNVLRQAQGQQPSPELEKKIADQLRAINPEIGADYTSALQGRPIPTGWSATGAKPYWSSIVNLGMASRQGWMPQDAQEYETFVRSYDSGVPATTLQRTSRLGDAALTLARAVKDAEAKGQMSDVDIANRFNKWIDTRLDDDPAWNKVFNAYFGFVQENVAVLSGGRPYVTDSKELLQQNPITGGPNIIRGIMAQDADQSARVAQGLNEDYQRRTGKKTDAPHYNPRQIALLRGIAQMNEDGTFKPPTDDLPPEVKELGRGVSGGSKIPPGWTVTPIQ